MDELKPTKRRSEDDTQAGSRRHEQWAHDPADVRRHAKLMRERQRVGPLTKLARYAVVVIVLVGAGAAVWKFDALRQVRVDFAPLEDLLGRGKVERDAASASPGGQPEPVVVEATQVVGAAAPTSLSQPSPTPETDAPGRPAEAARPTEEPQSAAPQTPELAATPPPPPPPPPAPERPPGPETYSFGLHRIEVSEANPSADLLILRSGDTRRRSAVTWWTTDGTAKAGEDYASLGRVVVKFAPGEQNRGIHIPIIGDKVAEGTESFFVNLAPGENATGEPTDRIEIVIKDDD